MPAAGRPRFLCYDQRYFCRMALWLELMVGIIMTILGLFILLLSVESLKEGDYAAVYFCSSFIVLGVALLFVYYIHYYVLKLSVKRQVQKLDSSIKSDQDALAALAKRGLQLSKFAAVRQGSAAAAVAAVEPPSATAAMVLPMVEAAVAPEQPQHQQPPQHQQLNNYRDYSPTSPNISLSDLDNIWETRQTTV